MITNCPRSTAVLLFCFWAASAAVAEVADAEYRSGATLGMDLGHTAVFYRYDHGANVKYVVHSAGGGDYAPNSVRIGTWSQFLGSNAYRGSNAPANMSYIVRAMVVSDALDQLNAHYWDYPFGCWKTPNSSPGSGDGCFRCDGLVEWVYEQNGHDVCNDFSLLIGGPYYQQGQMSYAVQTPPAGVALTYPPSTDQNNPTITHSSIFTLQATASDQHSGLSYNKPFDYWYARYINGSWTAWQCCGTNGGSQQVVISSPNTLYAWAVHAYDNGGNSASSGIYYLKWVPQYTIVASADTGGSVNPNGNITKNSGDNQAFTATPEAYYEVGQWLLDGVPAQTGGGNYTLYNIQANHSVHVGFAPLPAQFTGAEISNGIFQLQISGPAGVDYVIQASSNLTDWIDLSTNVIPPGGSISVSDPDATNQSGRFYRGVLQTF